MKRLALVAGRARAALHRAALVIAATGVLVLQPACSQPGKPCTVGAGHCSEWVLVLKPEARPEDAKRWLAKQGWPVRREVPDLHMLLVWLPTGNSQRQAQQLVQQQPWAELLLPQAQPL